MKMVLSAFVMLSLLGASAAYAKKPECISPPGQGGDKGKPEKVTLLHCGCNDTGDLMQYVEIQISSKSRGHLNHVAGSISSCTDGTDLYTDFVRSGSDCQLDGPEITDLGYCSDDKAAGQDCGTVVID